MRVVIGRNKRTDALLWCRARDGCRRMRSALAPRSLPGLERTQWGLARLFARENEREIRTALHLRPARLPRHEIPLVFIIHHMNVT
jgi:hypothetical protein